jgi:hypothetical protein
MMAKNFGPLKYFSIYYLTVAKVRADQSQQKYLSIPGIPIRTSEVQLCSSEKKSFFLVGVRKENTLIKMTEKLTNQIAAGIDLHVLVSN